MIAATRRSERGLVIALRLKHSVKAKGPDPLGKRIGQAMNAQLSQRPR